MSGLPEEITEDNLAECLPTEETLERWLRDIMDAESGGRYGFLELDSPKASPRYRWARQLYIGCRFCPF
jgi:hypothetical protein